MRISSGLSEHFSKMSLVCSFLVVFSHADFGETGLDQQLCYAMKWGVCSCAVPYFFLASGYFVAKHFKDPGYYGTALRSRIFTLFLPYVAWQSLFLVTHCVGFYVKPDGTWSGIDGAFLCKWFGLNPFTHPGLTPFWYIRALLILIVLTPLIWSGVRTFGKWYFICLFPIYLFLVGVVDRTTSFGMVFYGILSLTGFFYYGLGLRAYTRGLTLASLSRFKGLIVFLAVGLIVCGTLANYLEMRVLRDIIWILGIPPLLYVVWKIADKISMPSWLLRCSFGVYALHLFVFQVLHRLPIPHDFFGYMVRGIAAFIGAVGLTVLLQRILPRVMHFLCGGRG